jgi:hypothetical protein
MLLCEDPQEYMTDVDSLNEVYSHSNDGNGFRNDSNSSLAGKLKACCPSLFSSLNHWELEALEKSNWLSSNITVGKGVINVGQGYSSPSEALKAMNPFPLSHLAPKIQKSPVPLVGNVVDLSAPIEALFTDFFID